MRAVTVAATVLALLSGHAYAQAVTTPVTVKGNAFFVGDKRFFIRGVDYQPGGSSDLTDPLATDTCLRDIVLFKELKINTIRVYTIDNSKDHSKCMKALADAGIYLILDVNTPKFSISRKWPKESYNEIYLQHIFATVDVFSQYTNTLGFFAANEVADAPDTTPGMTYVKAAIRDLRAYIKKHIKRPIPVGYSAADVTANRMQVAHYLNCGKEEERAQFHAVNDYSWCGESSYQISGWDQKVKNFTDYSIPLLFSEFGCNVVNPRPFTEVAALYGPDMTPVFSGGLVYEYSQEINNYGLVEVSPNSTTVVKRPDFDALKKMYEKVPLPTGDNNYKPNGSPSKCPEKTSLWEADDTLPPMPDTASKYLESGAGAPRGTNGPSNQYVPGEGEKPTDTGSAGPAPTRTGITNDSKGDNKGVAGRVETGVAWTFGLTAVVALAGSIML